MIMTGDFSPDNEVVAPSYPTAFGITFTPTVTGIVAAIVGLGLSIYLGNLILAPTFQQFQELQTDVNQKEADLKQKTEVIRQVDQVIAQLNQAKSENADVRALFSTQAALDTLLLDLNRLIVRNNAQLLTFNPDYALSGPVIDGSLGPELNAKLKRQVTNVSFQGNFSQTLEIMRAIDRLQTVLVVRDLNAVLEQPTPQDPSPNQITSSFKLYAYVPLTPEEAAAAAKAIEAQQQPAQQ